MPSIAAVITNTVSRSKGYLRQKKAFQEYNFNFKCHNLSAEFKATRRVWHKKNISGTASPKIPYNTDTILQKMLKFKAISLLLRFL